MKKAQNEFNYVVAGLTMLVGLLVIILIVYKPWKVMLENKTQEDSGCSFQILLRTLVRKGTFGIGDIPIDCKMKNKLITKKDLDQLRVLANSAAKGTSYEGKPELWALNKIVANEMVDCYNKGFRGGIDIEALNELQVVLKTKVGGVCLLCARLDFDQNVKNIFGNRPVPMKSWLESNNYLGEPYSAFLTSSDSQIRWATVTVNSKIDTSKPQAVVFFATTYKEAGIPVLQDNTKALTSIAVYDYDKITSDLGFDLTGSIGSKEIGRERARCTEIIGVY